MRRSSKRASNTRLPSAKKITERGWEAITLLDVDGMKKLEGLPPAMVFILLEHYYHVLTTPRKNDVMGCVTQLIMKYLSGQTVPYLSTTSSLRTA